MKLNSKQQEPNPKFVILSAVEGPNPKKMC